MAFGDAAHQLERSESVISLTAEFSDLRTVLSLRDSTDSFQEIALRRSVCIDEEYRLVKLTWINPRASICGSRRRAALGGRTHAPADTPPA